MECEPWQQADRSQSDLHLIDHDVCNGLQSADSPVEHMMEFDSLTSHDDLSSIYDWGRAPPYGFDDRLFGLGCDLDNPHSSICDFTAQGFTATPGKRICTTTSMGLETGKNISSPFKESLEANRFLECSSSAADFDANHVVNTDFMNSKEKCFFSVKNPQLRRKSRCPILRSSAKKSPESDISGLDCIPSGEAMVHDCSDIWKETNCSESLIDLSETLHNSDDLFLQKNIDGVDDLEFISVGRAPQRSCQLIQRREESPVPTGQSLTRDEKPVIKHARIMNSLPPEDILKFARDCFKNILNKSSSDVVVKMKELQQKTEHETKSNTPVSQLPKPKHGTKKPSLCPQTIALGCTKKRKTVTKHGITIVTECKDTDNGKPKMYTHVPNDVQKVLPNSQNLFKRKHIFISSKRRD